MFTSHPSRSVILDRTEYYMTQINTWGMTGNIETFRGYRNARDWAKEQRDNTITRANEQVNCNLIESAAVHTSFSTVREASTEQSYFSFNDAISTDTPNEPTRSTSSDSRITERQDISYLDRRLCPRIVRIYYPCGLHK